MSDGESGQGNGVGLPRSALDGRGVAVGPGGALRGGDFSWERGLGHQFYL